MHKKIAGVTNLNPHIAKPGTSKSFTYLLSNFIHLLTPNGLKIKSEIFPH